MVATYIAAAISVVVHIALAFPVFQSVYRRSPAGVMKQLADPGDEYSIRLNPFGSLTGTWNPAKPIGIANPLCTLGHGTYRRTNDDHVELTWTTDTGTVHTYRGVIPDAVRPASPERRRARHILHVIGAIYAAVTVLGFGAGYLASHGSTDDRLGFGLVGVFAGWVLVWLVVLGLNVAHGTRATIGRRTRTS